MTVDASGLRAAVSRLRAEVAEAASARTVDRLRAEAPVGQTSNLLRGIKVAARSESGTRSRRQVRDDVFYASFTDEGTRPHVITPKQGQYLRFYWPRAGRVVYLRRVNHPGTKGTKWWTNNVTPVAWLSRLREAAGSIRVRA